ncbi:hypothetical protein HZ326_30298, partial [Fusarium oxysporum f. sp. albedinis]
GKRELSVHAYGSKDMPIPSLFEISATMPPAGGGNASALLLECYATLADEHMFARV